MKLTITISRSPRELRESEFLLDLIISQSQLHTFSDQVASIYSWLADTEYLYPEFMSWEIEFDEKERYLDPGIITGVQKLIGIIRSLWMSRVPVRIGVATVREFLNRVICNSASYGRWVQEMNVEHRSTTLDEHAWTLREDHLFGYTMMRIQMPQHLQKGHFTDISPDLYYSYGCQFITFHDLAESCQMELVSTPLRDRKDWLLPKIWVHPSLSRAFREVTKTCILPKYIDECINSILLMAILNTEGQIADADEAEILHNLWRSIYYTIITGEVLETFLVSSTCTDMLRRYPRLKKSRKQSYWYPV